MEEDKDKEMHQGKDIIIITMAEDIIEIAWMSSEIRGHSISLMEMQIQNLLAVDNQFIQVLSVMDAQPTASFVLNLSSKGAAPWKNVEVDTLLESDTKVYQ